MQVIQHGRHHREPASQIDQFLGRKRVEVVVKCHIINITCTLRFHCFRLIKNLHKSMFKLKGVCLLHLPSEKIFHVLRSISFYVLMKQKWIWNLSLCYFSLFCFILTGYDVCRSYCEAELLRGKVIQLGARDTNKLWECIIPADQSAD